MWYALKGQVGALYPELHWTPAIELRVQHQRWDRASGHPAAPGVFVNRHVAPQRRLPVPEVSAHSSDWYEDPKTGVGLSYASGPGERFMTPC